MQNLHNRRHRAGGPSRGRLLAPLIAALVAAMLLVPSLARADTGSSLTVIGTSDVSDSGLMSNVIQPAFSAAYPQYQFKYIGTGTGAAINNAESGANGASALLVHAASLENQFVANGYSYERYGRALFINDFVLAGPNGDPAGVAGNAKNNIAQAFALVANNGLQGKATFVSRGQTPGTTVQERQIWQLMQQSGLEPAGMLLCAVSGANGGGYTPIAPGNGVTAQGQACPNNGAVPMSSALPSWYKQTNIGQGPNVVAANACTSFSSSGPNSCYVFTDRGTYDYLASGTDPAGSVPNLAIVSRDNAASAPGGANELINYFHGYILNPAKPNQSVNLPAAQAFLNLLTSPALQQQIAVYLNKTADPGGAPFKPTAAPQVSATLPTTFTAGKKLKLTGTVVNSQPGYPQVSGAQVTVNRIVGNLPVPVTTGRTGQGGAYTINFTPPATGSYQVSTSSITHVEDASLSPVFGDILSPASSSVSAVKVTARTTKLRGRAFGRQALLIGSVAPGFAHSKGTVTISARKLGSRGKYRKLSTLRIADGDGNFAGVVRLATGRWQVQSVFADPGQLTAAAPRTTVVNVTGKSAAGVAITSLSNNKGKITTTAKVARAPKRGATIKLLALRTSNGGKTVFTQLASGIVAGGATKATLRGTLKPGTYRLQLQYLVKGKRSGYTGLRQETVKAAS